MFCNAMRESSTTRGWLFLHFAACPLIALVGAAWATDFPFLPSDSSSSALEAWRLQVYAITTACAMSLVTAYVLRSSDMLRQKRFVVHFAFLGAVLVVAHFLWVEPIWGFHHVYTLGVFAWLMFGGEDGFSVGPNFIGLPITVFVYWALLKVAVILLRSPTQQVAQPYSSEVTTVADSR
jgi:hypothetical protein